MTTTIARTISTTFASALVKSHVVTQYLDVYAGSQLLDRYRPEPWPSVTCDRRSRVRRTLRATLIDAVGIVNGVQLSSVLTPFGNEIVPLRGIRYPNGDEELVQMGVFGIETVTETDSGRDLVLTVSASDRAKAISRSGFTDTYTIAASTPVGTAIAGLVGSAQVGFTVSTKLAPTSAVTPASPLVCQPGADRWDEASKLADAAGCELYPDTSGVIVMVPVPDPTVQPVAWSYDEGAVNIAVHLGRSRSRLQTPNWIIRDGQAMGTTAPVRGVSRDLDPTSPTYVGGTYGVVVDQRSSALYVTQAQAQAAADKDLALAKGQVEHLTLTALAKPDHDVDDVVEVTRARAGLASARYVIDGYTLSETMDLTCRRFA